MDRAPPQRESRKRPVVLPPDIQTKVASGFGPGIWKRLEDGFFAENPAVESQGCESRLAVMSTMGRSDPAWQRWRRVFEQSGRREHLMAGLTTRN